MNKKLNEIYYPNKNRVSIHLRIYEFFRNNILFKIY